MTREIILDVETTGFSPKNGDKIIEIACLELLNGKEVGAHFHSHVNPCRSISAQSSVVHGLTEEFLRNKPKFSDIAKDLLAFLGNDKIIAHNASFDIGFVNAELALLGFAGIELTRVIDSLQLARAKISARSHSLDNLVMHFGIGSEARQKHDALSDVRLLLEVYRKLTLVPQPSISFDRKTTNSQPAEKQRKNNYKVQKSSSNEEQSHVEILKQMGIKISIDIIDEN